MRYGLIDGQMHAQQEIAKRLGISRSYISRIEKKAMEQLRQAFESGAGAALTTDADGEKTGGARRRQRENDENT